MLLAFFILKVCGLSQLSWFQTFIPLFIIIAICVVECFIDFIQGEIRSRENIEKTLRDLDKKDER